MPVIVPAIPFLATSGTLGRQSSTNRATPSQISLVPGTLAARQLPRQGRFENGVRTLNFLNVRVSGAELSAALWMGPLRMVKYVVVPPLRARYVCV